MSVPIVVLGASPTGLAVLRALGKHGLRAYVADTDGSRHCFSSRYRLGAAIVAPTAEEVVAKVVELATALKEPLLAIPTSDAMVLALAEHPASSEFGLRVYDGIRSGLVSQIVDKKSFSALCTRAGIDTPQVSFPATADEVLRAGQEFQFPLLLKPILGHLWRDRLAGKKVLVATSTAELHQYVRQFGDDCEGLMIQELIPGPETDIHVAAIYRGHAGGRDFCFVAEKTRQYPPQFGTASLATAKFNQAVEDASWKFVEAIDYRGICGTEFKFDRRDGRYKMIEVNPRPTLWFHLALAAGVELIYGAYCDLVGAALPEHRSQVDGTRWCYVEKDMLTWAHHIKERDIPLSQLLSTFSPFNHNAVATWADPAPLLASPLYYARRVYQRLRYRRTHASA